MADKKISALTPGSIARLDLFEVTSAAGATESRSVGQVTYVTCPVGTGSPEGAVTANPGTFYINQSGDQLWSKKSGTSNTGWVLLLNAAISYTAENAANKDTDGTLAANSDTKYASQKATKTYVDARLPSGVILMWSGTIASIPSGFVLCNGSNGTPDLRNRFIVGADADAGGAAKSTISGSAQQSGGSTTHGHSITDPGHDHAITQGNVSLTDDAPGTGIPDDVVGGVRTPQSVGAVDAIITNITVDDATTVQPYYALAYIMKT